MSKVAELIIVAFQTGDAECIANALGTVVRARGMTQVALDANLPVEAIENALADGEQIRLSMLTAILKALGMRLSVQR